MKKSHKSNLKIKAELAQINCLSQSKQRLEQISYLLFQHKFFANMKYKDLSIQLDLFENVLISEDLLRQYRNRKIHTKILSARRLKSITRLALRIDSGDEVLKEIYTAIENCEIQDFFEKELKSAEKFLSPIYQKAVKFEMKIESQFNDSIRFLANTRSEVELIQCIRNIYSNTP